MSGLLKGIDSIGICIELAGVGDPLVATRAFRSNTKSGSVDVGRPEAQAIGDRHWFSLG